MRYEYRCRCGQTEEREYPIGQAPDGVLCRCGRKARRVITAPGVVFRGSGWACKETRRGKELWRESE